MYWGEVVAVYVVAPEVVDQSAAGIDTQVNNNDEQLTPRASCWLKGGTGKQKRRSKRREIKSQETLIMQVVQEVGKAINTYVLRSAKRSGIGTSLSLS